jgi:hypothetical protein
MVADRFVLPLNVHTNAPLDLFFVHRERSGAKLGLADVADQLGSCSRTAWHALLVGDAAVGTSTKLLVRNLPVLFPAVVGSGPLNVALLVTRGCRDAPGVCDRTQSRQSTCPQYDAVYKLLRSGLHRGAVEQR